MRVTAAPPSGQPVGTPRARRAGADDDDAKGMIG